MISIDAFKVSWLYQEGLENGKAERLLDGKRSALRLTLASKSPLERFPEIDQVHQREALDSLLLAALEAKNPDLVRAAILAAVRPQ